MKKIFRTALLLAMMLALSVVAHAEHFTGATDWAVSFTSGKKMVSNFQTADLDEAISGMQPGDDITFTMSLKNEYEDATDWWMTNEVLYSLEDRSNNRNTSGGAYTYRLSYTDKNGTENVLFDSETIGGDDVEVGETGLHAATDSLDEFFYLDTLAKGQSGYITLSIGLDGETQGNDYQDTLADLQMNFAVELSTEEETPTSETPEPVEPSPTPSEPAEPSPSPTEPAEPSPSPSEPAEPSPSPTEPAEPSPSPTEPNQPSPSPSSPTTPPTPSAPTTPNSPHTGDATDNVPYYLLMGVCGIVFFELAIYSLMESKRKKVKKR